MLKKTLLTLALLVALFILFLVLRAGYVLYSVGNFKNSWNKNNTQAIEPGSIVIATLGDSTVQGIGALKKEDSFIGQVATRISAKTGKKVQIYNFSVTGAESGEVLRNQLPKLKNLSRIDAVILAVGPNDITHKKPLEDFLKNYEVMLNQLPAEKTVIANLPPMGPKDAKGRSSYEWGQALKPLVKKYSVRVALVYENVNPRANDFTTYGGDFYHPSKAGYKLWADAFEKPLLDIVSSS